MRAVNRTFWSFPQLSYPPCIPTLLTDPVFSPIFPFPTQFSNSSMEESNSFRGNRPPVGSTPFTPTAIPQSMPRCFRACPICESSAISASVSITSTCRPPLKLGIPVGNTPGVLDGATADLAFSLMLAAGRRLVEGDRYARGPDFLRFDPSFMLGREIHGATIGIFGMGRIGRQVAKRARGFDMTILYHNRTKSDEAEIALGARYATRDELLRNSDYIVLTVPLTAETRGLIGHKELALMKPTATLVNVARGAVVDAMALTEALATKRIHAAALDVTDPEPLPRDHPLLKLNNIIITPHLGSATVETRHKMAEMSVVNLFAGLEGQPLPFRVV